MENEYITLSGKTISLVTLTPEEKKFLGDVYAVYKKGTNYLVFENELTEPNSSVFVHAKRVGKPVAETSLYKICEDLAIRLGIRQGYLSRDEVVPFPHSESEERKELTTGQVAELAKCTREAVRKAIRTGRLRSRRVGRLSLIWEKDAEAFATRKAVLAGAGKR